MPMDVFTDTSLVSITGAVSIAKNNQDNVNGTLTVAGTLTAASSVVVSGTLTASSGLTVTNGASIDQLFGGMSASAVVVATSGTIASNVRHSRVAPAGAITAVVMATGTQNGQTVVVDNRAAAANTVTFAASATSNVAGGTGVVISGLTNRLLIWDGSLWN